MPTGAILYVQVPNSTTAEDWQRWRDAFLVPFDLEEWRDMFYEGVLDAIKEEIFQPDKEGEEWPLHFQNGDNYSKFKDVFPTDTYKAIKFPWYVHYGIGYERGPIDEIIAHATWLEENISGSTIWYAVDSNFVGQVFNRQIREALLTYYQEVGHEPYRTSREEVWQRWGGARQKYQQVEDREEELFLQKLRVLDGLQ
jgi:hypothetical protein